MKDIGERSAGLGCQPSGTRCLICINRCEFPFGRQLAGIKRNPFALCGVRLAGREEIGVTGAGHRDDTQTLAALPDGKSVTIRPLRPEDEPLLVDFIARIAPEDLRLRFFTVVTELPRAIIARLARVDFAHDMALIAQPPGNGEILGVARYMSDPLTREAEFAVLVRSDLKGHGIGWMLMKRLVEVARQRGIEKLIGLVLVENTNMVKFCRDLGFSISRNPEDPLTVMASLSLA